MDVVATLIELKPQSADAVEDWATYVEAHRTEAERTLTAEGVEVESWFDLSLHGRDYLLCYMRAESIRGAQEAVSRSTSPVDAYHQAFKQSAWVPNGRIDGRLVIDLVGRPGK
jgi:hypothetical protein